MINADEEQEAAPTSDQRVVEYYTSHYDEGERLTHSHNRLEFVRTCELLRDLLPLTSKPGPNAQAPVKVLDVGGGTGVYAAWLAADGYEVELIDLVEAHVLQAQELSASLNHGFKARVGNTLALDVEDASQDVCLLLGPLYHLPDAADRAKALSEAVRVTRPGGLIVAATISRYAWPLDELRKGLLTSERAAMMREMLATGEHDAEKGFTTAYMHRPAELKEEFEKAGLVSVAVTGVEGPGWLLFTPELSEKEVERFLERATLTARVCDGDMEIASASSHLLASGRRP